MSSGDVVIEVTDLQVRNLNYTIMVFDPNKKYKVTVTEV